MTQKKKTLWIVTEIFYPEEAATAYFLNFIAESLTTKRAVNVICGPVNYEKTINKDNLSFNEDVMIHRVKTLNLNKNILFLRIIRFVILTLQLSFQLLIKAKKGDEVLVVTNPAPLVIFASWISRVRHLKLNIIVHDIFPENLVAGEIIKPRNLFYRFLKRLFNKAYRNSDNLLVLGRDMQQVMERKLTYFRSKPNIVIIENWAESQKIRPEPKSNNSLIQELNMNDKIIFQYAGNLGRVQGLEELLEIVHKVNNPLLSFIFIGDGAKKKAMQKIIAQYSMDYVKILPTFPRSEQNFFLNAADIHIICLNKNMYGLGVPSKSYNILAAGKPILFLGPKDSEIWLMINEYQIGWCFEPNDIEGIIGFLSSLDMGCRTDFLQKGLRARKIAEDTYDKSVILKKYDNLYV